MNGKVWKFSCRSLLLPLPEASSRMGEEAYCVMLQGGCIWGFPMIKGTSLGGSHNKDYSILGSILGPPILGNYHIAIGLS